MFYAEILGDTEKGEPYILDRGVFLSIDEFIPYRIKGWSGTKINNDFADSIISNSTCIHPDCECLDYCEAIDPFSKTPEK